MTSQIVYTPRSNIVYARAFFITSPTDRPLAANEVRMFPAKYTIGSHEKATAFRLDWYENQTDSDARRNVVTEFGRVPTVEFIPEIPNAMARPDELLDVSLTLTGPEADANAFVNPIAVLEMVQSTLTTPPYLYLLSDEIQIANQVTDYRFRYKIGDPAAVSFMLQWYPTRLDSLLMVNRLTDTDRLPTARFMPEIPNPNADPDVYQDGVLRLAPSESESPYMSAVGLLCMVQNPVKREASVTQPFTPGQQRHRQDVYSNWRRK